MFDSYEFSFDGVSSAMYGLMIYDFGGVGQTDVSFANKADIVETRTNNRIQPLHFGVNYHSEPLAFKLVFGAMRAMDRFELEDISLWLTGHQNYKWLSIDQPDLDRIQFRCIITELTPLAHSWLPVAFEATVTCDCPYGYGPFFSKTIDVDGETNVLLRNDSSVREYLMPTLVYQPGDHDGVLSIVNHNDGDWTFRIEDIPKTAGTITVDNNNGIIREAGEGLNLYGGFNLHFFRLVQGDNNITITGNGTLTISGRTLHNVAG